MAMMDQENPINYQRTVPRTFKSPVSVIWYLTNRCNLNCVYCYNSCSNSSNVDISNDKLLEISKQIIDNDVVDVTYSGGEPLLRKDVLKKVIPLFYEKQIVQSLSTSGVGLTEEDVDFFEKYKVNITLSIDGPNAEIHDSIRGVKGSFDEAMKALKMLSGRAFTLEVKYVLTQENVDQFYDTAMMITNIADINVISAQLMVERGRARNIQSKQITQSQRQSLMEKITELEDKFKTQTNIVFMDPSNQLRGIVRTKIPNIALVIESNGRIAAHPYVPLEFGNILNDDLKTVWDRGLNQCWNHPNMSKYLKGMLNINDLGYMAESNDYLNLDFYSI